MKIAIRMDDISPDMDWEKWKRANQILVKYHIRPLLGVVPDNHDANLVKENAPTVKEEFWEFLARCRQQGYTIALHGCRHVYDSKKGGMFPLNSFSEFAGLPYAAQYGKLSHGIQVLAQHGIQAELFMAPAHTYDKNTLRALQKLGIRKVTDGFGDKPYRYRGITFYPIAHHLEKQWDKTGYTTYVLHTNTMETKDFERLERIVSQKDVISYGDYLNVEAVRASFLHRPLEYCMAMAKRILIKMRS